MLENVTVNTTIGELCKNPELDQISDCMFTHMTDDVWQNSIAHYGNEKCAIIPALKRICELTAGGRKIIYPVYSQEEIAELPERGDVKIIHMPGKVDRPFVLVCPGGGYAREWVLVEGYPIAERLNRMGYTAFVLLYRTGQAGLLPKPLDDVAQALRFINAHSSEFRVKTKGYAVTGFSAGGHLAAEWGTKELGYQKYKLEKPASLFLAYPAISNDFSDEQLREIKQDENARKYPERIGGKDFTRESLLKYSVEYQMDKEYPATYLVHCQDDPTVPVQQSHLMEANLEKYKIPHMARFPEHGGHSFGLGNGTECDGWLDQAVEFWQSRTMAMQNET